MACSVYTTEIDLARFFLLLMMIAVMRSIQASRLDDLRPVGKRACCVRSLRCGVNGLRDEVFGRLR